MKEEDTLRLVSDLISRTREGVYWDFKQKHHENKAELVHDVLCLANADWVGSRYLVYGIEDQTFEIVGVHTKQMKAVYRCGVVRRPATYELKSMVSQV